MTSPISAGAGQDADATPTPRIEVSETSIDLGRIREGQIVDADFWIENHGNADLFIENVTASCGCTTVKLSDQERNIPPGGRQLLLATFNTQGRPGRQTKTLTIFSNDPDQPKLDLSLIADVVTLFNIAPNPNLHISNVFRGDVVAKMIDLLPSAPDAKLELVSIELLSGILDYEPTVYSRGDQSGIRLRFTVAPDAPIGPVAQSAQITVRVGDETETRPLLVTGTVLGDLKVTPTWLRTPLEKPMPRGSKLRPIKVESNTNAPFKVLGASAGDNFDVQVVPGETTGDYIVAVGIADTAADGPCGAYIEILTDSSAQPVIRVPVYANVAPRVLAEPLRVLLDPAGNPAEQSVYVVLSTPGLTAFEISDVRGESDLIDAVLDDRQDRREGIHRVRVALRENVRPDQRIETGVRIATDVAGAETMTIPVIILPARG